MNRKILIIEDDPDIAQLVTMHVREAGYEAIHVDNGEQGLQEVEKSNPDLLVLDLMLPGMNGLEVCKQVRKQNERIPILMLCRFFPMAALSRWPTSSPPAWSSE